MARAPDAVEELVLAAVARRDWPAAARAARLGQGRLVSLLALVAEAARGGAAPASALWIRWLLAPDAFDDAAARARACAA